MRPPKKQANATSGVGPRVIVVAKRSAYGRFLEEGEDPRIRELLRRGDPSVKRWQKAHDDHMRTIDRVQETLDQHGAVSWVLHGPQTEFDASSADLVITVGGDGTLLSASHHVLNTPILGVNSAPSHSVGFFCAGRLGNIRRLVYEALSGKLEAVSLTRMAVDVDGQKVSSRVLNEALFCHASPAATSRYILKIGNRKEEHRSSGVWVGTAAGSTGALLSAGGHVMPLLSERLQVVVREPYQGERRPYALQRFEVPERKSVVIQNKMRDAFLFLDGPYRRVRVEIGETMTFSPSDQPLRVLGLTAERTKPR
jgi:NAD+ kinase